MECTFLRVEIHNSNEINIQETDIMTKKKSEQMVHVGIIGLGGRSEAQISGTIAAGNARICTICDVKQERIDWALERCKALKIRKPKTTADYWDILNDPEIDCVLIPTMWNEHIPIAIDCLNSGKYTAFEVGGACSLDQLWQLVHASEKNKVPCMMLENCCYDRHEMMALNMARLGLFGEIVHCECGYEHNLSGMSRSVEAHRQRAMQNLRRNGDLYPTHGVGPMAKILNINRGNRFLSLTSTASKACGFAANAEKNGWKGAGGYRKFNEGDVVTSVIKCANGETVTVQHCVSLPRPYSRHGMVQGTKGLWSEAHNAIFLEGWKEGEVWSPVSEFYEKYDHPLWKQYNGDSSIGHGNMDVMILQAFFDAVRFHSQTPIDVYDCAAWMAVTCLSEDSIATGSSPVAFPDFTNGKWVDREPERESMYMLSEIPGGKEK